ncbi:MAG: hypothetical protein M9939_06380 [Mesorhizobium sp.]|nr:hypothetical protein [Mesorhizobium sp.]MCO5160742.1 hypothetical protein [Mesorhizobium sp.]
MTRLSGSILFVLLISHVLAFAAWQLLVDGWPPSEPIPRLLYRLSE